MCEFWPNQNKKTQTERESEVGDTGYIYNIRDNSSSIFLSFNNIFIVQFVLYNKLTKAYRETELLKQQKIYLKKLKAGKPFENIINYTFKITVNV